MFYVYNSYILDGIIMQYKSAKWIRDYQDAGEFEIEMPFDREYFQMLHEDTLIYNKASDDWGIVTRKSVVKDSFGNVNFSVFGKGLNDLLTRRVTKYKATAKISTIVTELLNQNFIKPKDNNRKISNFSLRSISITNDRTVSVDFDYTDVLKLISDIAKTYGFGFRVRYDLIAGMFVFEAYEGAENLLVVFSDDYNNVSEQEYLFTTEDYKNTCYVQTDATITIVNGGNLGLFRREAFAVGTAGEDSGAIHLSECKRIENLETVVNAASPQFSYRQDWNLGDRVTTKNKTLGITMQKRITLIEEFYDETGMNLTIVFEK